jgi:ribose transport system ATP-binding protein
MAPPLFCATGLSKAYGAPVLRDVSIDLRRGEIHALVGENGAGKSTLARIIAGLAGPDTGAMSLGGIPYAPRSRSDGQRAGVAMVTQELGLLPTLTVGESLFLDRLPHRLGVIDRTRLASGTRRALERVGLGNMEATRPVASISLASRQLVEIAGALDRAADVLILDEPTSALSAGDAAALFGQVGRLRDEGRSIVFVSHRLAEVERIADRVTVLRDGAVVATRDASGLARDEMVRMMVGRDVAESPRRQGAPSTRSALRTEGLSGRGFRDVSLEVRQGEILGLAGLMGAGRTELLRVLFGADRPTSGAIYVGDSAEAATIASPREALARGLALLTEDRKAEGLLLPLSVRANTTLARLRGLAGPSGVVDRVRESEVVSRFSSLLGIRARSPEQAVNQLSGGNQQKVLLARWLYSDPAVLLVDEPTRGIDVASRAEIHRLLGALADGGKSVVVASSDLEELLAISDRIVVLSAGRVTQSFDRGAWTADGIMTAALRGHEREATA